MIKRYIASLGGNLIPSVTFTNVSACQLAQPSTTFTVTAPVGTILGLRLDVIGNFIWDTTVGSRNVQIAAIISTPNGAPLSNSIDNTYFYAGQTGRQDFALNSNTLFFVTVGASGNFAVQTNANIRNAGNNYVISSTFTIASINGQGSATQLGICTGFTTGQ